MTEFEMFLFLIGFAAGIACATVAFATVREARIDKSAPRVRTRLRV